MTDLLARVRETYDTSGPQAAIALYVCETRGATTDRLIEAVSMEMLARHFRRKGKRIVDVTRDVQSLMTAEYLRRPEPRPSYDEIAVEWSLIIYGELIRELDKVSN